MPKQYLKPTPVGPADKVMGQEYEHPAFGKITATRCQGGHVALFGSELRHNQYICVTIHAAKSYRSLSNDWNMPKGVIAEFFLSEHQWAAFVSSIGMGGGTECTLSVRPEPGSKLMHVPAIEWESKHEQHKDELKEAGKELAADLSAELANLEAMMQRPSIKKGELGEALKRLKMIQSGISSGLAFHVEQHKEMMEKNVQAAKSDVEGYITHTAIKLGLTELQKMAPQLEDHSEEHIGVGPDGEIFDPYADDEDEAIDNLFSDEDEDDTEDQ